MSQNATNPGTHLFVWRIQWDNACKYLARCKDLITVGCYYHTHVSSKSGSGWFSSWVVGLLGTTHPLSPEPSDPPDKMHGYQWAHSTTCPCGSLPQALLRSRFCSSHLGSSRIVTPQERPQWDPGVESDLDAPSFTGCDLGHHFPSSSWFSRGKCES